MENNKYEYVRVVPIRAGMKIFPSDGTTFEQLKNELKKVVLQFSATQRS